MPSRRDFLASLAAPAAFASAAPRVRMAVATTCYMTERRFRDTMEFLEHANALGAGGIQAPLTGTTPDYLRKLRAALEQYGMWIEVRAGMPKSEAKDRGRQRPPMSKLRPRETGGVIRN